MEEEKKNIFEKALDSLTSRDEEAELEEAKKKLADMEAQLAAAQKAAAEAKAAAAAPPSTASGMNVQAAVALANKRADEAEARARALAAELRNARLEQMREGAAAQAATQAAAAVPSYIAEHELKSDETLSHLALQYYGHATPPYWKLIYEANKELIGDNPNRVRPGSLIKIPQLPAELKD